MTRTSPSDFWLNCARAGMELCWVAAWVNYFALMIFSAPYPWHNALVAFGGASLAMWLGRRGQRRVYQVGLIHLVLMLVVVFWGLHSYYGQGAVLWDPSWLRVLAASTAGFKEVMTMVAIIAFSLLFWFYGRSWYKQKRDYDATSRRFDCGLAGLLGLLLLKFLLRTRFELLFHDPFSPALLIGFFCFALPALAWSRSRNRADLPGGISGGLWRSSLGMLITAMLLAGGAAAFYLPYLNQAAQASYVVLQQVLGPLVPYIIGFLKFIFGSRSALQPQASKGDGGEVMKQGIKSGEMPLWLEIFFYAAGGLLFLIAVGTLLILLVLAVRRFFCWLVSSTGQRPSQPSLWCELRDLLRLAWQWIARRILVFSPNLPVAVAVYYRLKKWGRRSGLAFKVGETPREYGGRLVRVFPDLAEEVGVIIEAHEQAVYAQDPGRAPDLASLRHRLRRLANPVWWPRRIKTRWRGSVQP